MTATWAGEAWPLQDIERRVQTRAKDTTLDLAGEGWQAKLRSLIADEVAAWSDAYKRGLRAFDLADPDLVAERAYRNLAATRPGSLSTTPSSIPPASTDPTPTAPRTTTRSGRPRPPCRRRAIDPSVAWVGGDRAKTNDRWHARIHVALGKHS